MWKLFRQPLSAKQVPVATTLILVSGVAVYGLYLGAAGLWHRHLLGQTIPAALEGMRAEQVTLSGIIEQYKSRFGYYPPLLTAAGPNRGILNPLCYELMGSRFDPRANAFFIAVTKDALPVRDVQRYFSMASFSNCLAFPNLPTNFLVNRSIPIQPFDSPSELFGLGLTYTSFVPEPFWNDYEFSPWRYATNPAEHNPGKFDLWVEVKVAGKHYVIGNWPEVK